MAGPSEQVLDLFAVPDVVAPLSGGQGTSVQAGDLVLSPGRDQDTQAWLNPILARLAVRLDERRGPRGRNLRVAMPVPARDGSWVVDGWGASRYEPGTTVCRDLEVTLAAGRLLHAELAVVIRDRPPELEAREDRWARAERLAFGDLTGTGNPLVDRVADALEGQPSGPDQLVHADLAGNVLLDGAGVPLVIDFSPAWRPVRWAEAVCVLDAVAAGAATEGALDRWTTGADRAAMLRAVAFRALSDPTPDTGPVWTAMAEACTRVVDLITRPVTA